MAIHCLPWHQSACIVWCQGFFVHNMLKYDCFLYICSLLIHTKISQRCINETSMCFYSNCFAVTHESTSHVKPGAIIIIIIISGVKKSHVCLVINVHSHSKQLVLEHESWYPDIDPCREYTVFPVTFLIDSSLLSSGHK